MGYVYKSLLPNLDKEPRSWAYWHYDRAVLEDCQRYISTILSEIEGMTPPRAQMDGREPITEVHSCVALPDGMERKELEEYVESQRDFRMGCSADSGCFKIYQAPQS